MQIIKLSETTAARRRLYFTTVDKMAVQTRLTDADIGSFTVKVSKNGGEPDDATNAPVEVDAVEMPGVWYIELTAAELSDLGLIIVYVSATEIEPRELSAMVMTTDLFGTPSVNVASVTAGAIDFAAFSADAKIKAFGILDSGTAQDGTPTSIKLRAGASSTDNAYKNARVIITGGTGVGQNNTIISYDDTLKIASVSDGWGETPDVTSTYAIFAGDSPLAAAIATLDGTDVEAGHSLADLIRLVVSMTAGEAEDFEDDTVRYYAMDGVTVRMVAIYNDSGRVSMTPGTLT